MREPMSAPDVVRFGDFALDLRSGELSRNGYRQLLPDQPFRLLAILIRRPGELITREELRHELWSEDTFVDFEAGLNTTVKRLREALGDSAGTPRFIETLPRRGYRFIAALQDGGPSDPKAVAAAPSASTAGPASTEGQPDRKPRTRTKALAFVSLAAVTVLVALVVLAVRWKAADRDRRDGPSMTRATNLGTVSMAALSPDGRSVVYSTGGGAQETLWLRRDGQQAVPLLGPIDGIFDSLTFAPGEAIYYTFFSPDKTNIALYRLSTRGGRPQTVLDRSGHISFSPDGSRYAYVSNFSVALRESHVVIVDTRSNATRVLSIRKSPESFVLMKPAWSPRGTRLAVFVATDASPRRLSLLTIDVNDGSAQRIASLNLALVAGAVWLPDGRHLIVSASERRASPQRLWSVSIASGEMRPLTKDVSDYTLAGVTPDGSRVVAVSREAVRSLWTADAGAPDHARRIAVDSGDFGGFEGLAWAPDGRLLYTMEESGNVDIWSIDPLSGERRRLTTDPGEDFHPSVSPDGRTLAFASSRSGVPGLWVMSIDGANPRRLTTGGDTRPSFSPDGRWVAFQRSGVATTPWMVFRVAIDTGEIKQITAPATMRPAVSPDGRFVAHYWMTADRWTAAVTPIEGGLPIKTIPLRPTQLERVVKWTPDGRALALLDQAGGASNIWLHPLDGQSARALTHFEEGRITAFDWSRDGSTLAWMRVAEVSDLVTIDLDRAEP
jgi:Tol biopolymer transport system component/DNA-binding winged helix-turn-helix (wHTH) protein